MRTSAVKLSLFCLAAPAFGHSRPFLLGAVRDWARARATTAVDAVGDRVGFTACDPGRSAPEPSSQRFRAAVTLLSIRAGLTVAAAKGHVAGELARCVARVFIGAPGAQTLVLVLVSVVGILL